MIDKHPLWSLIAIGFGLYLLRFRRSFARSAKRQNEAFWGGQYDERHYLIGAVAGGIILVIFGLMTLSGLVPWSN